MSLTIKNRAGHLFSNKKSEKDVTVRLTDVNGVTKLCNGFITEAGALVYGCTLDPEPEFELEYARPEVRLTVLNYSGQVTALEAWLNTVDGPRTVISHNCEEPIAVLSDESLILVGPIY